LRRPIEFALAAAIVVGDQPLLWPAQPVCHLERVHHQLGSHVRLKLPANDHPAEDIEDEGEVAEALPGADVGDVGDPLLVRPGGGEVALDEVACPLEGCLVRDRGALLLAAADALQALGPHQPADSVAAHLDAAAA